MNEKQHKLMFEDGQEGAARALTAAAAFVRGNNDE